MADKINDIEFKEMTGDAGSFGGQTREEYRDGHSSPIVRYIGQVGETSQIQTMETFNSLDELIAQCDYYESLRGTYAALEIHGRSFSNVIIKHVRCADPQVLAASTDSSTHMLRAQWTILRTQ